ncbi:unannotated protein [freshwater metagenome]|jgi:hypothetical protein|uniref:Unannotated protein n=1 Tax=freshwater metagenome TaxID=449393 RepID=A0A6J6TQ33_9ZZZZ
MAAMLLAHQGGWDEILFALSPLVVVAGLLALANRRANAAQAANRTANGTSVPGDIPPTPDASQR